MLHANSQLLVDELEALDMLEGRFTKIKLVNMPNGVKRGNFSLVFKAHDKIEGQDVALKFFELDPDKMDAFRIACFDREHDLLTQLMGAARCLQLASPISIYEMKIGGFTFPAKYFVTEWCDADIDEFFLRQDFNKAAIKLRLFNEVVLAVEALHERKICHRDIKTNNFRRKNDYSLDGVIAIDLGAAATHGSTQLLASYSGPVGLTGYSAPETFCGLAGNRDIAHLTDIYALGCLLFELFAEDDFWTAFAILNPDFSTRLGALRHALASYVDPAELLIRWDENANKMLAGLAPLAFPNDGASVPLNGKGVRDNLSAAADARVDVPSRNAPEIVPDTFFAPRTGVRKSMIQTLMFSDPFSEIIYVRRNSAFSNQCDKTIPLLLKLCI